MARFFLSFAQGAAAAAGAPTTFALACSVVGVWAITGPIFHFSDTWQLIINTFTSLVTFLMVFLIQNAQNRDTKALQLKLNELLRAVEGARADLVNLEDDDDDKMDRLKLEFEELSKSSQGAAS